MLDRYTKTVLTAIAIALSLLVVRSFFGPEVAIGGGYQPGAVAPPSVSETPKAWGRLVGTGTGWNQLPVLYFEAQDGTIRTAIAPGLCAECRIVRK